MAGEYLLSIFEDFDLKPRTAKRNCIYYVSEEHPYINMCQLPFQW
jgi:hypothetical protein